MITEAGKQQVIDELRIAELNLADVQKTWYEKAHRVRQLQQAATCDHADLHNLGGYIYMETICRKCGFRWYD